VDEARRNPRQRPRRGGNPRLKNGDFRTVEDGLSRGPEIRRRGALSGAVTTDCQQRQGCGGWSAMQPEAAPPPRRKAQAEKRISVEESSGKSVRAARSKRAALRHAAGRSMCPVTSRFECTNLLRGTTRGGRALAMGPADASRFVVRKHPRSSTSIEKKESANWCSKNRSVTRNSETVREKP
jgi:hypothetical protein